MIERDPKIVKSGLSRTVKKRMRSPGLEQFLADPGSGCLGLRLPRSAPPAPARARHAAAVSVMFTTSGG